MKKVGSSQASRGVTWNFEDGHFTSPSPNLSVQLKSMTFASGEQPKMGIWGEINRPLFNTFTGLPNFLMYFSYSFSATGSYFLPCSTAAEENAFCAKRSSTNLVWFLCLREILRKLGSESEFSLSHPLFTVCLISGFLFHFVDLNNINS